MRMFNMNDNTIGILDIVIRSILSVLVLFLLTHLLGKKQLSQLSFFDYIIGISIGSIAASLAIDDEIPYLHGALGILIYGGFVLLSSYLSRKSFRARKFLCGVPTILIQNGKLIEQNLRKARFHINEVLEECRNKGAFSISEVETAILETSGQVSIQLKAQKQPLTPEDMNISPSAKGIAANLIIDGTVLTKHLTLVNRDDNWLKEELKKQNVHSPQEVLLCSLDYNGTLHVDLKKSDPVPLDVLE
ncbi:DUF421 domain-containing protein [Dehalobacter sp. DCM]|uniref:DUF421 domain-containing protein n=1 Tax=Dehalobacter sp. DCM TaxID=2907827 RepID=UPI003081AC08|nr:DUF421 domain-containing protein [Dehalobacter sp. DCM]